MNGWLEYNTQIVLIGTALLGASAGVIGCYAVLRRRALVGDALAHASLPGVGVAFLILGERSFPGLLTGAAVSAVLGILLLAVLRRWTRLKDDAAIGLVLSTFYGAGVVLHSIIQKVGGGARSGLNDFIMGSAAGMNESELPVIAALAVGSLVVVVLLSKELKLVAFDAAFAQVQGWPAQALDLLTMALLVISVVIGLPTVGVVLTAALLILPAATARFWTERLAVMLGLAGLFGAGAGMLGSLVSASLTQIPAGPSIILAASAMFCLSLLAAPRRGLVARWLEQGRDQRLLREQLATEKGGLA